jgi:hypothetical protein
VGGAGVLLGRGALPGHQAADVNVSCAPSQRALVRQMTTAGAPEVHVLCVDASVATPAGYAIAPGGEVLTAAYLPAPVATPAVYYPAAAPVPTRAPRVARTSSAGTTQASRETEKPSWQKRVLVIGGTAGAGAGIGALIGGKKGALIGAAIGGGGAAVVDQVKNR